MRRLFWMIISVLTLNIMSYDVEYEDGLRIKFIGWPEKLSTWWRGRKI